MKCVVEWASCSLHVYVKHMPRLTKTPRQSVGPEFKCGLGCFSPVAIFFQAVQVSNFHQ